MIWPLTPCVPGGPSGRRWPGPKRLISTAPRRFPESLGRAQPLSSAPSTSSALAPAGTHRCLSLLVARLAEEACPAKLLVVRGNDRRETEEADPDERRDADDDEQEHEQEVEPEHGTDQDQAERGQSRPEQPFLERPQRLVAVELPRSNVVQHDGADQEHDGAHGDRPIQVGESLRVEGFPAEENIEDVVLAHLNRG